MRMIPASIFGALSVFASSAVAQAAVAQGPTTMVGDGLMDAVAVGLLVTMGIGLAALGYRTAQTT